MRNARTLLLAASALAAACSLLGCGPERFSFSVSVHNASKEPVTVWLTKSGGPEEADWLAPEQLAHTRAAAVGMINGVTIPPGRTGELGPLAGKFDADSLAMLRVYAGQLTLDQLLATPADGKLRVDVPLREGINRLRVSPQLPLRVERMDDQAGPPR